MKNIEFANQTIEAIKEINFFQNCGRTTSIHGINVEFIDKNIGLEVASSIDWENYTLERANDIRAYLQNSAHLKYDYSWNKHVEKFKNCWEINIDYKFLESSQRIDFDNHILKISTEWDLLHFTMEETYKKLNIPIFFNSLYKIYRAGHFPCGVQDFNEIRNPIFLVY